MVRGGLITPGYWWKSQISTKPPLTSPQRGGGLPYYYWIRVQDSHMVAKDGWGMEVGTHYLQAGMKVLAPYSAFSDITQAGRLGCLITASKSSLLGLCWQDWKLDYSFFCDVWLQYTSYCLKLFFPARLPLSWLERSGFCCCCCCWCCHCHLTIDISRLLASSPLSVGYMRQKENWRNSWQCYFLGTKDFSLPFSL